MYSETLEKMNKYGMAKVNLLKESKLKYFVASMLAGLYVGLGIILIMTIGGYTKHGGMQYKVFMGLAFGIALSLVIMAGSELFTGNNMLMTSGMLSKKITIKDGISIWIFSYFGNLAGSVVVGALFFFSKAGNKEVVDFLMNIAKAKMTAPASDLFFKGILCNILVCLAVLCGVKLKEETAKLIMIFWCLFAFITSGFEHSIANMTIFSAALFYPAVEGVNMAGFVHNLLWVTLGNMVGGCALGAVYYLLGRKK